MGRAGTNPSAERDCAGAGRSTPFLTVMLMASRHRGFVFEAIDSVCRQTLNPALFELLVVRDFDDAAVERRVTQVGGRSVRVEPGDIGPAIRAGIDASRGQILTFLDDDDRYLPERLAFLYNAFRKDDNLGFVKNNYVVIDAAGRQLPQHPFRAHQRHNSQRLGPLVLRKEDRIAQLRRLPPVGLDFNSSCMSVRRELVVQFIRGMEMTGFRLLDELALFSALTSHNSLAIDPTILTEYRIHSRNVSLDPQAGADPLSRRAAFSTIFLPSYEKLAKAVRTRGDADTVTEAEGILIVQRAYAALRDPTATRSIFLRLRRETHERRAAYFVRTEPRLRQALWLFTLAPPLGRWLYAREVRALEA